ncbi:hypothetical protein E2C01_074558 [Portunus trituberculatus]|uniref:Uncharacterized protein n=1 Tax=Portunus trituberculatus TaxID=210409 RepID=A0A5B7IDG6_PORTR|nr:hypothetical protein [Portunus trituberculatus]
MVFSVVNHHWQQGDVKTENWERQRKKERKKRKNSETSINSTYTDQIKQLNEEKALNSLCSLSSATLAAGRGENRARVDSCGRVVTPSPAPKQTRTFTCVSRSPRRTQDPQVCCSRLVWTTDHAPTQPCLLRIEKWPSWATEVLVSAAVQNQACTFITSITYHSPG